MKKRSNYIEKPKNDRSGKKIMSWTLLSVSGVKRYRGNKTGRLSVIWIYKCRCVCGNISNVSWSDLSSGKSTKCRKCHIKQNILNSQIGVSNFKNKNPNYRGTKNIPHTLFSRAKHGAAKRNIEFNITIEDMQNQYEKQKGLCYYTGQYLEFYPRKKSDKDNILSLQASLDRVDSSGGYTINNIVWSTKTVNRIKMDLNKEDFVKLCKMVYYYNKDKTHE